ncbi:15518_t:CDS:2, partial [Dentiscutata heterogama]
MASTFIPIEEYNGEQKDFSLHDREQVTMIACSPNFKYIATWSDMNKSAVFWSIPDKFDKFDNQQQLKPKYKILLGNYKNYNKYKVYSNSDIEPFSNDKTFGDIKNYFTVSDDEFVAMPIERVEIERVRIERVEVKRDETESDKIERVKSKVVSKTEEKYCLKAVKKNASRVQIGIFNFVNGEYLSLNIPHSEIMVESLAFLDGNKLVMISKDPLYRIYIFTHEKNKFIHKSTIKVESYNEKIFLSNEKLFIYDKNLGSITKWDIDTLKFEEYFLFDNSFDVDNMKLSENGVLLFVYGTKRMGNLHKDPYPCISVYSADHGNKFTTYTYEKSCIIDTVYLIASDIGARLLIVFHKNDDQYHYSICDPFTPRIPGESYVNANYLFKDFEAERDKNFEYNHIVKSDKIVGFNSNGTLVIKKLIPDKSDTWISYLRETLNDSNSIFISSDSEKIKDLIRRADDKSKETTDKTVIDKSKKMVGKSTKDIGKSEETTAEVEKTYSKYFISWTLKYENNNKHIILTAKFKKDNKKDDEPKSD